MRKYIIAALATLSLVACNKEQFHIEGTLTNAKDSLLYFEHNGLDGFTVLDSVRLDDTGAFSFHSDQKDNPEFYRLRIAGQIINIAIDSTETINIKASYPLMATDYTVSESYENAKIRELALKQIDLQTRCQQLALDNSMNVDSTVIAIRRLIEAYKNEVSRDYIFKEPMRAYAYFALFQYITVNNQSSLIFNPRENVDDAKVFGAVATSWDAYYPDCERGRNLHNIAIEGLKDRRIVKAQQEGSSLEIDASKISESGVIDLPLLDNNGKLHHLTDLKGQVVLLNFHVFESEGSMEFIMALREVYNKYHARGLEIYQVSLDENEHFWKTQTAALPWINVHDSGTASQAYLAPVASAPIFYLIDRDNNIVRNPAQIVNLEKEIESLL